MTIRIHLDTDFGGDPDDLCALAMLFGWPGVEITGITTTIDAAGLRAACLAHCLDLAGRNEIPFAAGAPVSLTTGRIADPFRDDERYWPTQLAPRPSPPGAARDLRRSSIEAGAAIAAIGPLTNLALLEQEFPGALAQANVVAMGGWVQPPEAELPAWGPEMDFNIQWDTRAAAIVAAAAGDLTLVPLGATLQTHLRATDLPRLRAAGPLGALIARQSETYAADRGMAALGRAHPGLPDDLLNFLHDPLACAVALAWPGAPVVPLRLRADLDGTLLRFTPDRRGRPTGVVPSVDPQAFRARWLQAVGVEHMPELE
jgi:inosine-uridine nucleoside N-ribohydrolase